MTRRAPRLAWTLAVLIAAGCDSGGPAGPAPAPAPGAPQPAPIAERVVATVECEVVIDRAFASCAEGARRKPDGPEAPSPPPPTLRFSFQGMARSAADSLLTVRLSVGNRMGQALGTVDGVVPHTAGVRLYLVGAPTPTSGSGTVALRNPTGVLGSAPGQPFVQYTGILRDGAFTPAEAWEFRVAPGVGSFSFTLLVAAEAEPRVVFNEFMANPGGIDDRLGEYVELFNAGRLSANLRGFILRDDAGVEDTIRGDLVVEPGAYLLLGRSADPARNGGLNVGYVYTGRTGAESPAFLLDDAAPDHFVLRGPTGVTLDSVRYTQRLEDVPLMFAARPGVARELKTPTGTHADADGEIWADPVLSFGRSQRGTPGAANSVFTP